MVVIDILVKMAKSLRSKWKRKMRSIKREKNAVKELNRLKAMLENVQEDKNEFITFIDLKKKEQPSAEAADENKQGKVQSLLF